MTVPASMGHAAEAAGAHADADPGAVAGMLQQALPTHEYANAEPADMASTSTAIVTMATKRFMPLQTWCLDRLIAGVVPFPARNRSYPASFGRTGHMSALPYSSARASR
jgi:hypothetical protein